MVVVVKELYSVLPVGYVNVYVNVYLAMGECAVVGGYHDGHGGVVSLEMRLVVSVEQNQR